MAHPSIAAAAALLRGLLWCIIVLCLSLLLAPEWWDERLPVHKHIEDWACP